MTLSESEAKIKRRSIKASATRLRSYLESPQAEFATKFELLERKNKLANLFEQYDEVQSRIEVLEGDIDDAGASNVIATHAEERARFEEAYFHLMSLYDQRLNQFEHGLGATQSNNAAHTRTVQPNNVSESQIRLPKIQLPSFSGTDEDWYTFHDSFDKLIHTNEGLITIQKFHYLRSSLKDKAAEVIKSFDITVDNYAEAWQLLIERFDNKRRIIQTHIKAIFETAPIYKKNCAALRNLLDNVLKHFRAFKALQRPVDTWDDVLIHLVLTKLDPVTIKEWETSRSDATIPTFKQLTDFLSKRCQALEAISNKSLTTQPSNPQRARFASSHVSASNLTCVYCREQHFIFQCESFRKLPVEKRFKIIKNAHLCTNCLKARNHQSKDCPAGSCRKCGKTHNTLLHFDSSKSDDQSTTPLPKTPDTASTSSPQPIVTQCTQISNHSKVLLSTAIINVYDFKGDTHICRALLDNGSQLNFITESLANKLQLNGRAIHTSISGVAQGTFESNRMVNVNFKSRINAYQDSIHCIVLPKITQKLPQAFLPSSEFKIPANLTLADPNFNIPSDIDLLIGAQLFWQLICMGQIKSCKASHFAKNQAWLGLRISGISHGSSRERVTASCHLTTIDDLNKSISKFWEVEHDISFNNTIGHTSDEHECEKHFQQNTYRNSKGRFVVKLPVNKERLQQLGNSEEIAKRRFILLERRLSRQPDMYSEYRKFMQEYIDLRHMREVKVGTDTQTSYYLPHHAVLKENSITTKLRVAFDASCKSASGLSLNDTLLVGPTIQEDLFSILIRFRTFQVAMTADITKMYRQVLIDESQCSLQRIFWRESPQDELKTFEVLIDESQCSLQRIFWRESPQDELKTFELLTVTYGTAAASFLAIRSLRKLAEEERDSFPIGAKIVLRDFSVDDMVSGASTFREALEIKRQTTELLSKGGFELRKWSSNHPSLQDDKGLHTKEFNSASVHNSETRTLGIIWNCELDIFKSLGIGHLPPLESPTMRGILSKIALVFDPLGLIGPSIVAAKIIMQQLWLSKIDWDDSLPSELHALWKKYETESQLLDSIEIPRKVIVSGNVRAKEIHGFADASQRAYGACIYLRSISCDGKTESHLLCSKSRVAPLKTLSIPRLELCGALLLAQLTKKVQDSLPFKTDSTYLWTDSRIVLCWLRACSRQWLPFVANRVAEIQRITNVNSWRHIPSQDNPADLLSRGINPGSLAEADIWWSGSY